MGNCSAHEELPDEHDIGDLRQKLAEEGMRSNDRKPEGKSPAQQAEWRQRHRNLKQTLYAYGWEQLMAHIL